MKQKYISQSPYLTAGLTRAELFGTKRKRDTSFDGIATANRKLQKKRTKKKTISLYDDDSNYWRFT